MDTAGGSLQRRKMKKKIIGAIAAVVLAFVAWNWYNGIGSGEKSGTSEAVKGADNMADLEQKVLGFTIDGRSPKGVKQWTLEGKSAEIVGDIIHLYDLSAVAYGEDVTVNLTSDEGIYRKDKGEVTLIGNVNVVSDDGLTLATESATWSQVTKEISTDDIVRIKRSEINAIGKGGMANSDERKALLEKEVTVVMEPDTEVYCDGPLEVLYSDNKAIFHNNVKVKDLDGKLFADTLTVEFNTETKRLSQVTAEGNVKLKRGNSYTLSEKAVYTETTRSAKLLGRPRLIIDPDEISKLEDFSGNQRRFEML